MPKEYTENIAWRAVPFAGLAAGTAFLIAHFLGIYLFTDINPQFVTTYYASLVLGTDALLQTTTVDLLIGIAVHYALSILFTFVITFVIHRWGFIIGVVGGALLGLAIYSINFYTMTVYFDWMFTLNGPVMVVTHMIFGAVAGGVYEMYDSYDTEFMPQEVAA